MLLEISGKTDVGRQRTRNEDHLLIMEEYSLTAVADGMGGHVDGNIASQIAVDTLMEKYTTDYQQIMDEFGKSPEKLLQEQEKFLSKTVQDANKNIFSRNRGAFSLEGMGTTIVALQISLGYAITACVGDSRIYLLRKNNLVQLTQDHSLVSELLRYNIIAAKDLHRLQNKNIITRALGMSETVLVDTNTHEIFAGDIFLLCSDGLTDLMTDEKIGEILAQNQKDIQIAKDLLVDEANNLGGQDNITVNILKINE